MIPGFSAETFSTILITYGLISNYYLAVTAISLEISYSFFEFLSPMIFGIGNEVTGLAVDCLNSNLTEESMKNGMNIIACGGLAGILISLPVLFFADRIYPIFYSSLKPIIGWILLAVCAYMIWIERGSKKLFAAIIFGLSGLLGLIIKNSGIVNSDYLLLPVFIGFYGFGSLLSKRQEKNELIGDMPLVDRIKNTVTAFSASLFASLIPGMKKGQAAAIALQTGNILKREQILFILPAISLSFVTLSIFVLNATGSVRSTMAYDIQEIMGDLFVSQTVLFIGSVAIAACLSVCMLILLSKHLRIVLLKVNRKYLEIAGFCIGVAVVINFTGFYGILISFTATSISILSSRFRVRSTHLMGVLLVSSIMAVMA